MKIYCISGLGADQRVFQFLDLNTDVVPLVWIPLKENDTIQSYAKRLSLSINKSEDFILLGVSFGGLIATEISKITKPKLTILISSIETKMEMPFFYRVIGFTKFLSIIPPSFFNLPLRFAMVLFGTNQSKLLKSILNDTDLKFTKWAVLELINWKNETTINPVLKISSTKDRLLPSQPSRSDYLISNGHHFMIVDKAMELSEILNNEINSLNQRNT